MPVLRRLRAALLAVSLLPALPPAAHGQGGAEPTLAAAPENAGPPLAASTPDPSAQQPAPLATPADHPGWGTEGDFGAGPAASARGPFSLFSGAEVGRMPSRADYRATWFPDEGVKGQGTELGFVRQDLTLSCPVWQAGPDEWSVSAHVRNELFHTGAVFPDTGQAFPDELWDVRFGTTYRHLFDNGWVAGGTVSVGSASDRPFHSIDEMTAGVNGFLRVPQGEHNAWLFTLSYTSNSELPVPLPGVAFLWQPSDQLRMNLGLPFQVTYRPCDDLTFDLSYMLLTTVHARATYRVWPALRVYGGYDSENESYLPADRTDDRLRLFYYDQRLTGGAEVIVSRCAALDVSGGYTFDRFYFEGHSLGDRSHNRIEVGAGPFLSAGFRVRW